MEFLHTLGRDETFWVGLATVQAALMIALVVEGRTALEQFEAVEQQLYESMHQQADQNEVQLRKLQQDWRLKLPFARPKIDAPSLVVPKPTDPGQGERRRRIAATALALPVLAVGLISSLLAMSPIEYAGTVPVALAGVISALSILLAIYVLVVLSLIRITGRTVGELLGKRKRV